MYTIKVFIHWDSRFISTDIEETVTHYLEEVGLSLKEYAIEDGIIEDSDSLFNDEHISVCYDEIFDDIYNELNGWSECEIDIVK